MKPLLQTVAVICLALVIQAHPENIDQVKELPQEKELILEAEESQPQARTERCTTCNTGTLNLKPPKDFLADIKALPGAEVHTQSFFEGCSSDKGCAGLKTKDGKVVERFGNVDAFKAASAADTAKEFSFHSASVGNVFENGIPNEGPFWWMTENSPFKNGAGAHGAGGATFEKFSKSSSYTSAGGANGAGFGGDLSGNPFLNGDFSKLAGAAGFTSAGGAVAAESALKPQTFQTSSYEASYSTSSKGGEVDIGKNPFLNGAFGAAGLNAAQGQFSAGLTGFGAQGSQSQFGANSQSAQGFGAGSQAAGAQGAGFGGAQGGQSQFSQYGSSQFTSSAQSVNSGLGGSNFNGAAGGAGNAGFANSAYGNKYSGFTGSSPSPFTASTAGPNVNLIQTSQKTSEFDFESQQTQSNIDEAFQGTGNVVAGHHEHSGGDLQQTCAGQGYVCVHKAQCNNGVVNSNGAGILQANSKKQYCNTRTEICCRIEVSSLAGAGGLQGSLGVGGATYQGQGGQGQGLFVSQTSQSSFTSSGTGNQGSGSAGYGAGQNSFGAGQGYGSSQSGYGSSSSSQSAYGSSSFGSQNSGNTAGTNTFGAGSGYNAAAASFGSTNANRGVTASGYGSTNKFGSNSFGTTFGSTPSPVPTTNRFNTGSEVYKSTSQSNFIETDSFSAGSENTGIFRPQGLKPGIPYLPPVDNTNSGSNVVSSTAYPSPTFVTTPRPFTTPKPTYLPPVSSTSAPGYLPPQQPEQTIQRESFLPPGPNYIDGSLILDENRFPTPKRPPPGPAPSEIPAGCAAALKCTPVEFCTADGVISNTSVILTRDQEAYRVPLTDCKDVQSGQIGKCCRDPLYTDPWPVNQLGKWVPGVFGGNDGKYTPDSKTQGSINRPTITARPPVTGSVNLDATIKPVKPTISPFGPNQVTPGFPTTQTTSFGQKGQYDVRGQGQFTQTGQGQFGVQGQTSQGSGAFGQSSQGFGVTQGQGQYTQGGTGQFGIGGEIGIQRQTGIQGQFGQLTSQSQKKFGQALVQGEGQEIEQGIGQGIRQGGGFTVKQGGGVEVENEYSESTQRVFLTQYNAGGQCGLLNGQKPFGNRNELEVDFAEIPWQAMVLLQTNRSLLCGGVITRPDVVITSAACVEGLQAKNVLIKGGEWKLGIDDEPLPFQIVQVKTILRHPFYKRGSLQYDAAILVLAENLRFAKNIYPICLPGPQETLDAFYNGAGECIVTGWGKQVLQAHLAGSIMHSINVSLINPGECQAKLSSEYPHLLENYNQDSCVCGQPTNPANNICKVDIGSALACTTGDGHFVMRGVYSWDSGCQLGNQLAAFYKFDSEWYNWAIGLLESAKFAKFAGGVQASKNRFSSQLTSSKTTQVSSGVKGAQTNAAIKGTVQGVKGAKGSVAQTGNGQFGQFGQGQFSSESFSQFSKFGQQSSENTANFNSQLQGPLTNTFTATYTEKKVFQTEPKIVTYTTKPEIVTFTTKPEIFTFTTKPKIVSYTTKPQVITYETSGSSNNPTYVSYKPASFSELVDKHKHSAACKCLENGKK